MLAAFSAPRQNEPKFETASQRPIASMVESLPVGQVDV
jgi:hypothetical protein